MKQTTASTNTIKTSFFRFAYFLFLGLVVYQLFMRNYEDAISNLGIALIFDPFDQAVRWNDRPTYQKVWLFTHLAILMAGFAFLIFR